MTGHRVIHGDCTVVLRDLAREGLLVDSVVTDPPYHLASIVARLGSADASPIQSGATGVYARGSVGFMGQQWDGGDIAFRTDTWRRVFDVMKPGAHLVAFAATKGYHRMVCAIEDAGFAIRDMVAWLYGTGFPHSHNIDGAWEGWGTNLKPAIEPIMLAQKPISESSIAANLARWGAGALNIDACRIHADDAAGGSYTVRRFVPGADVNRTGAWKQDEVYQGETKPGRWPANLCHDGSPEVLEAFAAYGERGAAGPVHQRNGPMFKSVYQHYEAPIINPGASFHGDSGTAARFFYSSKATQGERIYECRQCGEHTIGKLPCDHGDYRTHPTVKPLALMQWLVEMITPPGGLVLDPFAGTGTTAAAARAAGMQSLSIEASADHIRDIALRLAIPVDKLVNAKVESFPTAATTQRDLFL